MFKRVSVRWWIALLGATLLSSCSPPPQTGPKGSPVLQTVPTVRVPYKLLLPLAWKSSSTPLPASLKESTSLSLGSQNGAGVLLGSEKGLYTFANNKFARVDPQPVRALAQWKESYLAVAREKEVQFWDGVMHDSQLFEQQDRGTLLTLRGWNQNRLWLATENQLWLLQDKQLTGYKSFPSIVSIACWSQSERVVLQDRSGAFVLLKRDKEGLSSRPLGWDKVKFEQIVVGPDKRLWATAGGALYTEDDKNGWKQVLLPTDASASKNATVLRLAVSAATGHLWVLTRDAFFLLSPQGTWGRQIPPTPLTARPRMVQVGQFQSLWWVQENKLWRLSATTGSAVSYTGEIAPFLKRNCHRCHGELGPGRKMLTLEQAQENIAEIIDSLEKGRMPPDKKPLVGGDVTLFKRWKKEGMKP